MIRCLAWVAYLGLFLPLAACGADDNRIPADVLAALEKGQTLELISLDHARPVAAKEGEVKQDDGETLHGWKVLGNTVLKDAKDRGKLLAALQTGVRESDGTAAKCFNPRHALRASHGGKVYEVVICFECFSAAIHIDGKREPGFLLNRSPQPTFDALLKEAKVPLPKGAGK